MPLAQHGGPEQFAGCARSGLTTNILAPVEARSLVLRRALSVGTATALRLPQCAVLRNLLVAGYWCDRDSVVKALVAD